MSIWVYVEVCTYMHMHVHVYCVVKENSWKEAISEKFNLLEPQLCGEIGVPQLQRQKQFLC